jgi:hypothetical protein
VRAGETYSVFVAIHNLDQSTGAPNANCVKLTLDPNQIRRESKDTHHGT